MLEITEFLSNFQGGARANRFAVQITWPTIVGVPNVRDHIVCRGASLPASQIGQIPVAYMGRQIPVPGDRIFDPWTIQVHNDESFSHRDAFVRWLDAINSHRGNTQRTANYKDLTSTLQIRQLSRSGNVLKTYKMFDAFPISVGEIALAYDDNDTIEIFDVQWAYSEWQDGSNTN